MKKCDEVSTSRSEVDVGSCGGRCVCVLLVNKANTLNQIRSHLDP